MKKIYAVLCSNSIREKEETFGAASCRKDEVEYEIEILAKDSSILHTKKREKIRLKHFSWKSECIRMTKREAFLYQDTLRIRYRLRRVDGQTVIPATFSARTSLSVKKRNFLWDIERFSLLEPHLKVNYPMSNVKYNKMILSIQVDKEDKIMIFFQCLDRNVKFLKFQSFISDINGSQVDCGKYEIGPKEIGEIIMYTIPFSKKYLMNHENKLLKNDVLSLCCECSWSDLCF
ncbi:uncharacterized protein TNIN_20511 [Trichonephila inaurata madagascariensis]|uniref:Uncharacterized protein n=1 Tax=Trichonephila inaurata madagascariensis TaxID=2747483 RepID=A0A8X6WNK0_9ARAC|nr:uncharacterized protein TNIN_20511 [Trichonephila inaurata madagascariensis]